MNIYPSNMKRGHSKNNLNKWRFSKTFILGFDSHGLQYTKSNASAGLPNGKLDIISHIHSLPWEKLYFYLAEKEYNTIKNTCQSAYVEGVKIQIFNLGVGHHEIQCSSVRYRTVNSQDYFSIWRGFEKFGSCSLGVNITPEILYGKPISSLQETGSWNRTIRREDVAAISELRRVDNRVVYHNTTNTFADGRRIELPEGQMLLPSFLDKAKVTMNAGKDTGLAYETIYRPRDGNFHSASFESSEEVSKYDFDQNVTLTKIDQMDDIKYFSTDKKQSGSPTTDYKNATIENGSLESMAGNVPIHLVDGLGVGLFPKKDKLGNILESTLELMIQTEIIIRTEGMNGSTF